MKFDKKLDLNALSLFVTMVDARSLTAAAERSGMTRSNVSHRLKALELVLGAQLLRRSTRHIELTQAGQLLYDHAGRMLDEVEAAKASIDSLGQALRGHVRIRLPTGLGHLYLAPLLLQFSARYPEIALRVLFNDHIGDLIAAEVDVALKITSAPPVDHVARKVCSIAWCLCASPGFLAQQPPLDTMDALAQTDWITPSSMGRRVNLKLCQGGKMAQVPMSPRLQSGDYPFLVQAALSGLGVALLPRYAVWQQLQDGRLREVMPDHEPEGAGDSIYVLTAPNRFPTMATNTLIGFIQDNLRQSEPSWARRAA